MARVHQINVKPKTSGEHGLPKHPVAEVRVRTKGLEGDYNNWRTEKHPRDLDMAVLLMPLETLEDLNREGWPLKPGDIGENFTTQGIPYASMAVGKTYSLGSATVQISKVCAPCTNLYLLPYVGDEKGPAFIKTMVGRRGWYARVLREGTVRKGDPVREV